MILILGTIADREAAYICAGLLSRGEDFLVVDSRHYPGKFELSWEISPGGMTGCLRYGSREIPLPDVRSVYVRQLIIDDADPREAQDAGRLRMQRELASWLVAFANTLPALVVSRPSAFTSNFSKPYQQQLIRRHGFKVPKTLVTTFPEDAARFYAECRGQVIYKSVSDQRSIVSRLSSADLERLDRVRHCPTQFQEYIPGVEIRVHNVGSELFATEILTDATDYRYHLKDGNVRTMRPAELPPEVAAACVRVCRELGIIVAGVDLRRTPDGEYYCLEVNPSPGFTFYQNQTGQRIGDAVVDLLCRGAE
jgi:glutathione synthase/RimK-type ligase-like ATP-grasp enzyme